MEHQTFSLPNGATIAYHKTDAKNTELPTVMFCGGFMSDMSGGKATFLEKQCQERGQGYIRFDYTGHGKSSEKFTDGTIGIWMSNALAVLDELTSGSVILVGSSMGGWISLLLTLQRPERISAFIGIAAAPDFTDRKYNSVLTDEQRIEIKKNGIVYVESEYDEPYPITLDLINDGKKHLLLKGKIDISCPIRLLQGKLDTAVSWERAIQIQDLLTSNDVIATIIKDGDHSLSRPSDLSLLNQVILDLNSL